MSILLERLVSQRFRYSFRSGLERLLAQQSHPLSDLVLVLANAVALGDQQLFRQVHHRFSALVPTLTPAELAGEDAAVLHYALRHSGPSGFIKQRTTSSGWRVLSNELRNFRPRRAAAQPAGALHQPFDPNRFNFGRVQQEIFHRQHQDSRELAFYFQKYPLTSYHSLIVPEPAAGHPQYLGRADHLMAWKLTARLKLQLPRVAVAYNSLGAFASINHLHFHLVVDGISLPIWQRLANGTYPLPAYSYTDASSSWDHIHELQEAGQTFNLLYRPGQVVVIPRRAQGTYDQPDWTSGMAWFELAGGEFVTSDGAFKQLTDANIEAALGQLAPTRLASH